MNLRVTGIAELKKNLEVNIPKQIRFATMGAINDVAKEVQRHEVEKQLPSKLTLRSPWWKPGTRFGVNIRFATRDSLQATVGSQAPWLRLQEEGGTKTGGSHRLAVEAGARPGKSAVLPRALKPRQLLRRVGDVTLTKTGKQRVVRSRGAGFIINTSRGPAIFTRSGFSLKLMYGLEGSARIPAVLNFSGSAAEVVTENYQRFFDARFKQALATAKPS